MGRYRITTNGLKYRIEVYRQTFFLRKWKWMPIYVHPAGYMNSILAEFDTPSEVISVLEEILAQDAADERGFVPVDIDELKKEI